jgi:fructose-1,6-bisphosphatase/inositol monophosphatase family enzyme
MSLDKSELNEYLTFAHKALDGSSKIVLDYLEQGFKSEIKADKSVVTEADKAAEEYLRGEIEKHFPSHTILGEEYGGEISKSGFQWVIDPIDGTANFLTGIPTFGTILALFHDGHAVVGMSDHPALKRRYHATKGGGVFFGQKKLQVRGLSNKELDPNENVAISSRLFFEYSNEGQLFDEFVRKHPNIRIYRDVSAHGLVAQGSLGAMIEFNNMPWDLAVSRLYTEEAGGLYLEMPSQGSAGKEGRKNAIFGAKKTVNLIAASFGFTS